VIDSGLVGRKVFFIPLVRSHEERICSNLEPTQSRISPSILWYTKKNTTLTCYGGYRCSITSGMIDSWEGYRESRRCSRDTYPESYITKYTCTRR